MVQCICTPAAIFSTNLIGLQPIGIVYLGIGIVHSIVIMHKDRLHQIASDFDALTLHKNVS